MGTNSGSRSCCVELDRGAAHGRCARSSRTACARPCARAPAPRDARLPPTRALAADLGVSRRLVVDAYAQLLAEGYLIARPGAGTFVADGAARRRARPPPSARAAAAARSTSSPATPTSPSFPRRPWLRALRETLREAPDRALGYPDPRGAPRAAPRAGRAPAPRARRRRRPGVDRRLLGRRAGASRCSRGRSAGRAIAVEDPGLPPHRAILAAARRSAAWRCRSTSDGARVEAAAARSRPRRGAGVVLVTPAHQSPTGVALSPARRAALLAWAAETGALVIEDDYDAEYRYDRAPLGALQGLAPDRVRLHGHGQQDARARRCGSGWLVLPARLLERGRRAASSWPTTARPTLDQLALARLLESGAYDRHLRQARGAATAPAATRSWRRSREHLPGRRA